MSALLELWVTVAMVLCIGMFVVGLSFILSDLYGRIRYRSLLCSIQEAALVIDEIWAGEPVPPDAVYEILVLLHKRRLIDFEGIRSR